MFKRNLISFQIYLKISDTSRCKSMLIPGVKGASVFPVLYGRETVDSFY